jgi:hypothetical protein
MRFEHGARLKQRDDFRKRVVPVWTLTKAFVARIVPLLAGEPQYQDEVPVGGTFRG